MSSPMKLLNGIAGFWVAIFRFTSNNTLIPTVSGTAMLYAIPTIRPKLLIITYNLASSVGLGSSMVARNRSGSFSFKCRT